MVHDIDDLEGFDFEAYLGQPTEVLKVALESGTGSPATTVEDGDLVFPDFKPLLDDVVFLKAKAATLESLIENPCIAKCTAQYAAEGLQVFGKGKLNEHDFTEEPSYYNRDQFLILAKEALFQEAEVRARAKQALRYEEVSKYLEQRAELRFSVLRNVVQSFQDTFITTEDLFKRGLPVIVVVESYEKGVKVTNELDLKNATLKHIAEQWDLTVITDLPHQKLITEKLVASCRGFFKAMENPAVFATITNFYSEATGGSVSVEDTLTWGGLHAIANVSEEGCGHGLRELFARVRKLYERTFTLITEVSSGAKDLAINAYDIGKLDQLAKMIDETVVYSDDVKRLLSDVSGMAIAINHLVAGRLALDELSKG